MTDTAKTPATAAPSAGAPTLPAPAGAVNPGPAIPAPFSFARLFREGETPQRATRPAVNLNGPRLDLQPSVGALLARLVLTSQDLRRQVEGLAGRLDSDTSVMPTKATVRLAEHILNLAALSEAVEASSRAALRDLATRGGTLVIKIERTTNVVSVRFTPAEEGK